MHAVLTKTAKERNAILSKLQVGEESPSDERDKHAHLKRVKASEVRVVKYAEDLKNPTSIDGAKFEAQEVVFNEG